MFVLYGSHWLWHDLVILNDIDQVVVYSLCAYKHNYV